MAGNDETSRLSRRGFLKGATAGAVAGASATMALHLPTASGGMAVPAPAAPAGDASVR